MSGPRSMSAWSGVGSSSAKRGLLVRSGSSASDVHDINVLLLGVGVKKDPIRTHTAAPGGTFRSQPNNVTSKGLLLHFLQSGPKQVPAFSGSFCELFWGRICDVDCP